MNESIKDDRKTTIMFHSDLIYILIMSLIGITGGILSGKAMSHASIISPPHLQDDTGSNIFIYLFIYFYLFIYI